MKEIIFFSSPFLRRNTTPQVIKITKDVTAKKSKKTKTPIFSVSVFPNESYGKKVVVLSKYNNNPTEVINIKKLVRINFIINTSPGFNLLYLIKYSF